MAPWMWIIGGPNGAGKSSFAAKFLDDLPAAYPAADWPRELIKLNADVRTLELRRQFPEAVQNDLNLRAAQEVDAEVARLIDAGESFSVETVLSSPKYRDKVETAKAGGFRVGLIYISLHPPELSPQRVSERTAKGGHDVDPVRAVERYHRSHEQLRWFAPRADFLMVFDNSDNQPDVPPELLAVRFPDQPVRQIKRGINPAVDAALRRTARPRTQNQPRAE